MCNTVQHVVDLVWDEVAKMLCEEDPLQPVKCLGPTETH